LRPTPTMVKPKELAMPPSPVPATVRLDVLRNVGPALELQAWRASNQSPLHYQLAATRLLRGTSEHVCDTGFVGVGQREQWWAQVAERLKVHGTEGSLVQCRRCGSEETTVQEKQTRSADEAATMFCTCTKCGKEWRIG